MSGNYAIVAAPVTGGRHKIDYDGDTPVIKDLSGAEVARLDPDPDLKAALPPSILTAESVGKLMVEMSENPDIKNDFRLANREAVIKSSLAFFRLSGNFSKTEENALLDATEVEILFETRTETGATDKNTRIIVVPADSTLKVKENEVAAGTYGQVPPPLSYQLDTFLMFAFLRTQFKGMVQSFVTTPAGAAVNSDTVDALLAHVDQEIDDVIFSGDPTDIKDQILKDPIRAFHRSVGIYATNMCR